MSSAGIGQLPKVDAAALEERLRSDVDAEVRFDAGSRGAYSTDASNYRQVPIGVVVPRTVEAAVRTVQLCHEHDAPVLSRGGGTSLGGQCVNVAIVLDWTKYCHRLVSVDERERSCVVEPGIVLDQLNGQLSERGLNFGPTPATHSHCTLGGMIGNNSCGASAQRYGKTVDNVLSLEILTHDGLRCWVGPVDEDELTGIVAEGGERAEVYRRLRDIRERYRDDIERTYPAIPRRVSGYNLDSLALGDGIDPAKLLVGSEGTLVTVLHAELRLVPVVEHKALLVLGYSDIASAADAVPALVENSNPLQLEGLGGELVHFMREEGKFLDSVAMLPSGQSWLFAQYGGNDP